MKATAQKYDVSSGFRAITLLVEDFTPFPLGVQVELTIQQIEQPQPPANVVAMAPATAENVGSVVSETGNQTNTSPTACDTCKGSGVVAQFADGQTTGTPTTCEACKGSGVKQA